jgi:hypothetical protein
VGLFVLCDIYNKHILIMKHLLNNLSEEEKNNIREQHEGGMKISTENFKQLLETKSGDAKPYLNEQNAQKLPTAHGRRITRNLTVAEIDSLAEKIVGKLDDKLKDELIRLDVRNDNHKTILVDYMLELLGVNTDPSYGQPLG